MGDFCEVHVPVIHIIPGPPGSDSSSLSTLSIVLICVFVSLAGISAIIAAVVLTRRRKKLKMRSSGRMRPQRMRA